MENEKKQNPQLDKKVSRCIANCVIKTLKLGKCGRAGGECEYDLLTVN